MAPIEADFDGILPPYDLLAPLRQISMTFCPFSLMGPLRHILMAFYPVFTDGPIKADFDGILPLMTYEAQIGRF